jgi:hypothetical protein
LKVPSQRPSSTGGLPVVTQTRIQRSGESLQEFAAADDQVAHRVLVRLPNYFILREAGNELINGVKDCDVKQHHLVL